MTRIVICTAEYPPDPGGIGVYMHEIAMNLHDAGYDISIVTLQQFSDPTVITQYNHDLPFAVYNVSSREDWRAYLKHIRQIKPDLMITCDLPLTLYIWLISKVLRIPLLAIAIGSELRYSSRAIIRMMKRVVYSTSTQVVSISQITLDLMKKLGINTSDVPIVYPGGDANLKPDVDSQALRQRYGLEGKRVILTMGGLSPRKGQEFVLRAMPRIIQQVPDAHYVMAGRDRTDGDMPALAKSLGIEKHVTFTGQFDEQEKSAFFNLSEFCLITSQTLSTGQIEGYGIVIIEAALCGRTSIGTWGTGTEEAINHGETGLLVPQRDAEAVAETAIKLLEDETYRQQLADKAYHSAIEHATWDKRLETLRKIIPEMMKGR